MRSRYATERRDKCQTSKMIEKFRTVGSWMCALKASFLLLSACSSLVWGVCCFRSVTKHGIWQLVGSVMPFSSVNLTTVSCHICCSVVLPPQNRVKGGWAERKSWLWKKGFFKPSSTSPLIRKMQHECKMISETKGRLCCFVLIVWVVHLKIYYSENTCSARCDPYENCFALSCKICC